MKNIVLRLLVLALLLPIVVNSMGISARAVDYVTNDGYALDVPYGILDIPSSYDSSVKYYDVLIPYNLKLEEIGGWCDYTYNKSTGAHISENRTSQGARNGLLGGALNLENCHSKKILENCVSKLPGLEFYDNSENLCVAKDKQGNEYYIAAFGQGLHGMYSGSDRKSWSDVGFDPGFNRDTRVIDVIFKDGTVVHFIIGDYFAKGHAVGGDPVGTEAYHKVEMKYPQYAQFFYSNSGHIIELWAPPETGIVPFQNKYHMGTGENSNRVIAIRMYDVDFSNPPARIVDKTTDTNVGDLTEAMKESKRNGSSGVAGGIPGFGGIRAEEDLEGMPHVDMPTQNLPSAVSRDSLVNIKDIYAVQTISDDISLRQAERIVDILRISVVAVGLFLVVFSILMFGCIVFDKVNTLFDFSLVEVLSLGYIKHVPYTDENNGQQSNTKWLVIGFTIIVLIGLFIASGGVMKFAAGFVAKVYSWVGTMLV